MNTCLLDRDKNRINSSPNNTIQNIRDIAQMDSQDKEAIASYRKQQEELKARSDDSHIDPELVAEIKADIASNYRESLDNKTQNVNAQNNSKETIER